MLLLSGRRSRRRQYETGRGRLAGRRVLLLFRRLFGVIAAAVRLIGLVAVVLAAIVHRLI